MRIMKTFAESSPKADYFIRRVTGRLGKPFNGQHYRMALFEALLNIGSFDAIIETGTNRGSTTQYLAEKFLGPIFTIEYLDKYAEFSRIRLKKYSNVKILVNNSVDGLKRIFDKEDLKKKTVFFYLDAHWYDYLPLRDELNLILNVCKDMDAVIMIDDFAVPDDDGYGFDSYATGTLNFSYIETALTAESRVFFPSTPANIETGFRQGCAVIVSNQNLADKLSTIPLLRQFNI